MIGENWKITPQDLIDSGLPLEEDDKGVAQSIIDDCCALIEQQFLLRNRFLEHEINIGRLLVSTLKAVQIGVVTRVFLNRKINANIDESSMETHAQAAGDYSESESNLYRAPNYSLDVNAFLRYSDMDALGLRMQTYGRETI